MSNYTKSAVIAIDAVRKAAVPEDQCELVEPCKKFRGKACSIAEKYRLEPWAIGNVPKGTTLPCSFCRGADIFIIESVLGNVHSVSRKIGARLETGHLDQVRRQV